MKVIFNQGVTYFYSQEVEQKSDRYDISYLVPLVHKK